MPDAHESVQLGLTIVYILVVCVLNLVQVNISTFVLYPVNHPVYMHVHANYK